MGLGKIQMNRLLNYNLQKDTIDFLLENIKDLDLKAIFLNSKSRGEYQAKGQYSTDTYQVLLDQFQLEALTDELTDLLVKTGLNENDEPTSIGLYIESLINIFNPYQV
jgi:hypothetical protein